MSTTPHDLDAPGGPDLVSVVLPLYNAEKTLDACLSSVEAQTHANLEIICVNDGSTDGTLAVARAHAAADPRVRVIDKPNEGYGASCNRGIAEAHGTWVAIVEPDDMVEPTCYEDLLACAARLGGADAVDVVRCAYWREFPAAGADVAAGGSGAAERVLCPYARRVRPARQPFAAGDGVELLLHHPAVWAGMYRRGYLAEQGIHLVEAPGASWTDNPFLAETLLRTRRIAYTDRPGYVYRERDLNEADAFAGRSPLVPLTRWNEMMDVADATGEKDPRVLAALALRGVNYAVITVEAAGADPSGGAAALAALPADVRNLVERSMRRIPEGLVASREAGARAISPTGRRLHAAACGLSEPRVSRLSWYAHLAGEALYRVRVNGLGFAARTALHRRGGRLG